MCHLHATGKAEYDEFMEKLAANGAALADSGIEVRPYIDDMPRCMAAADLVVCRCGAMTTTELLACGKPSILIPSPNVAENHQFYNAQALVQAIADTLAEADPDNAAAYQANAAAYIEKLAGRVQRLSVGVQSFDNDLLKQMDRYEKYGSGEVIFERIQESQPYHQIAAIAFNMSDYYDYIKSGNALDVCYSIVENYYRGNSTLQLRIKDLKEREEII